MANPSVPRSSVTSTMRTTELRRFADCCSWKVDRVCIGLRPGFEIGSIHRFMPRRPPARWARRVIATWVPRDRRSAQAEVDVRDARGLGLGLEELALREAE